jgi:hypothetical protein
MIKSDRTTSIDWLLDWPYRDDDVARDTEDFYCHGLTAFTLSATAFIAASVTNI